MDGIFPSNPLARLEEIRRAGSFAVRQSKTILAVSGARRRLTKTKAIKPAYCFSDKVGHWNCVIFRESCKSPDLHFPL